MFSSRSYEWWEASNKLSDTTNTSGGINKSAHDAIGITRQRCRRYNWVLEFGIKVYSTTSRMTGWFGFIVLIQLCLSIGNCLKCINGSGVSREIPAPFCESLWVKCLLATQLRSNTVFANFLFNLIKPFQTIHPF